MPYDSNKIINFIIISSTIDGKHGSEGDQRARETPKDRKKSTTENEDMNSQWRTGYAKVLGHGLRSYRKHCASSECCYHHCT